MHYKFPWIETIDDVLPAIEGADEFSVTDKGDYTCINYNLMKVDTFPPIDESPEFEFDILAERNKLRRECRGILFSNETKKIIRRPLHKFFNVNEKEETAIENLRLNYNHSFEVKRDGSMIAPFKIGNRICFGTKAGETDVSKPVDEFVSGHADYLEFAEYCIKRCATPIFEWCSRKQRIILDYPKDELVLLAIREMNSGEYINTIDGYWMDKIPMIERVKPESSESFLYEVANLEGIEGFVLTWPDGHKCKIKTDEYVKIHRAKDALSSENKILVLYFENKLDDLLAALSKEEQGSINEFCKAFDLMLNQLSERVLQGLLSLGDISRKDFALNHTSNLNPYLKPIYFSCFETRTIDAIKKQLYKMVEKNILRNINYDTMKESLFPELELNYE